MFYREASQYKTSYGTDQQVFPILQDRVGFLGLMAIAFVVIPVVGNDYWFNGLLIPFLILALATLGLNILTGFAGQISLGSAGFMGVGAFAAYNFALRIDGLPILASFVLGSMCAAVIGALFGLACLRIKDFYLIVATLGSQFFIEWALTKFGWLTNYSSSGVISAQKIVILGVTFDSPLRRYLLVLAIVTVMALAAKNMMRGAFGRSCMAVRDMDVAAAVIGIRIFRVKLAAFVVSSFYCGMAGALWAFAYVGTVDPEAFGLERSLQILFMAIIGGLGSIMGSFLGAAFIMLLPIFMNLVGSTVSGKAIDTSVVANVEQVVYGVLIIWLLVVEPGGLVRLWQIGKEKLRLWPFPR
ncbi:MAG: branched-chain amino acid ABC transporter permease [Burkholderiales bacterium]|nr:branched-chain amino acid ABC transporter permease [Burkholderiales bacterium]